MADVATVAEENIVGVHVVKSFAQEQAEQDKFERRSEAVFSQSVKANRQRAFYVPPLSFLPLLAQAAVLLIGGHMVANGTLPLDDFVRFNLYLGMLVMPLRCSACGSAQAQRATASGERIFQVMDEPEEIKDAPGRSPAPARHRARALRGGHLRLRRRPPGAARRRPRARAGQDGRADRPHRLGQDDARLARAALLRRRRADG